MSKQAEKLRSLLKSEKVLLSPCAYDALSAKAIEAAGFPLISTTGSGIHAAALGAPDLGLLTLPDVLQVVDRICDCVRTPVMVDAEAGYGNAVNVYYTVQKLEKAGAAGLFIEDQKLPTNCPLLKTPALVSIEEMCGKIRAAVQARKDPNLVIAARTDAPFEEAVERAAAYLEAGADLIKPMPKTRKELELFPQRVHAPLHVGFTPKKNFSEGLTAWELGDMGYRIVTFASVAYRLSIQAMLDGLARIHESGTAEGLSDRMISAKAYFDFIGRSELEEIEKKYVCE